MILSLPFRDEKTKMLIGEVIYSGLCNSQLTDHELELRTLARPLDIWLFWSLDFFIC